MLPAMSEHNVDSRSHLHPLAFREMFRRPAATSNWSVVGSLLTLGALIPLGIFAVLTIATLHDPLQLAVTLALLTTFTVLFLLFTYRSTDRQQRIILVLQTAIAITMCVVPGPREGFLFVIFAIASAQLGLSLPPRTAALWWLILLAGTMVSSVWVFGREGILVGIGNATGHFFFVLMGGLMRQAQAAREQSEALTAELQIANAQLRAMSLQAQQLAVAEERNRMARELHDSLGHRLTVAVVQLEGAQRLIPIEPERAARMIGAMRDQMKDGLGELRQSVASLREPLESDLPLGPALQRLAQTFQEGTGLMVHVTVPAMMPDLQPAQRLALFRAAQEALTNAQRHAQARQVWLTLDVVEQCVTLAAEDDGVGFDPSAAPIGYGLRGLDERATQLGGQLQVGQSARGGARVIMTLPQN